ncbi:hypothetical protein C8A00DRAFT_46489 [Chaetomidium leptoderma]|uniref:Heterokaryon incompatibility domain-containing protein n=1 Tax=Chaetomidium leptoderma TaxID=669021 RepID=A0AAN6VEI6_9PEZI|nr:hypothetical protein C8A00DRAFT_46489 [Chaetomidium leptoderma]
MTRQRSQSNPNPRRPRPPYNYTPLSTPRHIRLIRLLHYDPILSQLHITLTEHPIDAITHTFTALSCTWGSAVEHFEQQEPRPPHPQPQTTNNTIELIIGALLDTYTTDVRALTPPPTIGANLSDFLRAYLVSHLWIDAVCIDQSSPAEKAGQIPLMGEIYSLSGRVLGMMKLREGDFVDAGFWREVVGLGEPPMGGGWARAWVEYWGFYRARRYFHRVWIVQEVVDMAGFAGFLGHVAWIDVLDELVVKTLSGAPTTLIARGFGITDISGMQRLHQRKAYEKNGWPEHWWAALSQDKVFATVGILQQALPAGTPLPFPVDATATPEEVYTRAATALVLNCPQLTLLSLIEHPIHRNLTNLPSWVPDLTTANFPWPLGAFDTPFTAWAAPSPSPPPRTITPTGELCIRGFRLDTIASRVEDQTPRNSRLAENTLHFLASLPANYVHAKVPAAAEGEEVVAGQFREAALVHTLTCHESSNINRGTAAETERLSLSFGVWLFVSLGQVYASSLLQPGDEGYSAEEVAECEQRWQEIEKAVDELVPKILVPDVEDLKMQGEAVAKAKRGEGPWPEYIASPQEFVDQVRRVIQSRCLFKTAGGWIGLCSDTCQVGDEVWLLEGGAVPYVLRRCGTQDEKERFVFCGECYVHGVMDGQLTREKRVEEQLQDIVIV